MESSVTEDTYFVISIDAFVRQKPRTYTNIHKRRALAETHAHREKLRITASLCLELKATRAIRIINSAVSSRPLIVFDRAFKDCSRLKLEDLTFDDIQIYVERKFNDDERFKELAIEEPDLGSSLARQVVMKASGVFLWVKLVVHSLLEGMRNFDRGIDLEKRLNELPQDLDDLYWHMLDRVRPVWYLGEGFKLLLLVYHAVVPLALLQLAFAEFEIPENEDDLRNMSTARQNAICRSIAGRIKSRCLGLLEVTDLDCKDERYRRVEFLHKSVRDFIETPRMMERMQSCLSEEKQFIAEISIIRALSIELKTIKSRLRDDQFCEGGGLTREAWFDEVRPIVFEAVRYAAIVESKAPKSRQVYGLLIDEINRIATSLWDDVHFRAPEEIAGTVHWSDAPRKPGAVDTFDLDYHPQSFEESYIDIADTPNATENDTIVPLVRTMDPSSIGPVYLRPSISTQSKSIQGRKSMSVRFAGLPIPQCYPGQEDDDERPKRHWLPTKPGESPFKLPEIYSPADSSFETFARRLGLTGYASERLVTGTDARSNGQTYKIDTKSDRSLNGNRKSARMAKKSSWRKSALGKLKSVWLRKG